MTKRAVLAIPLEEVRRYFEVNARQSLKIVAPARLGAALLERLRSSGVEPKPEAPLEADCVAWRHSGPGEPNRLIESGEFPTGDADGVSGFTVSFGTEHGSQEIHVHRRHAEIYFSEHPLAAEYRESAGDPVRAIGLPRGGAMIFAAGVEHRVKLGGLTLVIEAPAVEGDKFPAAW